MTAAASGRSSRRNAPPLLAGRGVVKLLEGYLG